MEKTKFGIIGADMSRRARVVEMYFPRECAELVAVCDILPKYWINSGLNTLNTKVSKPIPITAK